MAVDGKSLAALSIGSLFIWSGIKGWSILGTVGDVIKGGAPSGSVVNPLTAGGGNVNAPAVAGDIASLALQYQGHAYSFGGAPGKDGSKPWDCSSFVNFIVGILAGMSIPGYGPGVYDGSVHGPVTTQWGIWPGMTHVSRSEVQANDIVVWTGHMGICVSNTDMISALNPSDKTKVTSIDGNGNGPLMCYGRLKSLGGFGQASAQPAK